MRFGKHIYIPLDLILSRGGIAAAIAGRSKDELHEIIGWCLYLLRDRKVT